MHTVWVGPLVVKELKRIVEASEITKCVSRLLPSSFNAHRISVVPREDDTNWPKKNIVGKQELEIRVGNDHIAFEVSLSAGSLRAIHSTSTYAAIHRLRRSAPSLIFKIVRIRKA